MRRFALATLCLLAIVACGGPSTTSTTTSRPAPTATPTPLPPDNEMISQGATGIGVYQLISIPVVVIHNNATRHSALGVSVHFTVTHNGRPLDSVDSPSVDLGPGQTMAMAGDCTDTCTEANAFGATVTISSWGTPAQAPVITTSAPSVTGGTGRGQANANATLSGSGIAPDAFITGAAACYGASGAIVGGGASSFGWAGKASQSASVPVIVSSAVAHCDVYAALSAS